MNSQTITPDTNKQADIAYEQYGEPDSDHSFLLLHGGAGVQSVTGLAQRLADRARVYVPTHPGFGGTNRPDWLNSVGFLADIYVAFIKQLDLRDVTVIGSSIGGWIAAEIALRNSSRVQKVILIDAAGIAVEGQPVVDIFQISPEELSKLSYYNPAAFRFDPSTLTDAQKRIFAANRQALAVYGGQPSMTDPTLRQRLGAVTAPTLVLWGDSDGVVTPDYGRAYAAAIPTARFQLIAKSGHLPQIEAPDETLAAIWNFVGTGEQAEAPSIR